MCEQRACSLRDVPKQNRCLWRAVPQIMKRAPASVCEDIMVTAKGLAPVVALLGLPTVPLINKSHAAGACAARAPRLPRHHGSTPAAPQLLRFG